MGGAGIDEAVPGLPGALPRLLATVEAAGVDGGTSFGGAAQAAPSKAAESAVIENSLEYFT